MEFTVTCPVDGSVEVGLEDIETVVLRDSDRADITFLCPHCGTRVTVTAIVPAFLLAAIEALAEDPDLTDANAIVVLSSSEADAAITQPEGEHPVMEDARFDAYCEYFRRQLNRVECAEDAVAEMDTSTKS